MNLLDAFRRLLRRAPPPSKLRNRAGGMAFINRAADENDGGIVLVNRIVCTEALGPDGNWIIDPPQVYRVTRWLRSGTVVAGPGDLVLVRGLHDNTLTPLRDISDDERSQEADFQPKVPATESGRVPA